MMSRRTLILGLGNDILTDDAVGLRIASELSGDPMIRQAGAEVLCSTEMGLALLDLIDGQDELFILDSIQTTEAAPGFIHILHGGELAKLPGVSPHFLGIGEMLALGRELHLHLPGKVTIYAIEVADPFTVGNCLSPVLEARLPSLVNEIRGHILASVGRKRPSQELPSGCEAGVKHSGASTASDTQPETLFRAEA